MDLQLTGRTVLVTGGSSGVGLALVEMLAAEGANVVTCARRGDVLASALQPFDPKQVVGQACDVRDAAQVNALVDMVRDRFGGLDDVVNNAGQARLKRYPELTDADWRDELELKFSTVLNVTSAALPLLRGSDAAAIVNVNAILARQPDPGLIATSAARAGLLNLTKSLSLELAADGIRVNSVSLGLIDTGQWRRRYEQSDAPLSYPEWASALAADRGIPFGRLGTAEEAAYGIITLLSPRASYITGATLDVCGGASRYV